jgi:hypothetical protein
MFKQAIVGTIVLIAVNTSVCAEPLDRPLTGPKWVCFKYSTFFLNDDERVAEFSGSAEGMRIKVESPSGSYEIAESEIFAPVKGGQQLVFSVGKTRVYRIFGRGRGYVIYGPTSFSQGNDQPIIALSGEALRSATSDRSIFDRLEVRDPRTVKCEQTFTYGWGL